jgi:hypothetical protein
VLLILVRAAWRSFGTGPAAMVAVRYRRGKRSYRLCTRPERAPHAGYATRRPRAVGQQHRVSRTVSRGGRIPPPKLLMSLSGFTVRRVITFR